MTTDVKTQNNTPDSKHFQDNLNLGHQATPNHSADQPRALARDDAGQYPWSPCKTGDMSYTSAIQGQDDKKSQLDDQNGEPAFYPSRRSASPPFKSYKSSYYGDQFLATKSSEAAEPLITPVTIPSQGHVPTYFDHQAPSKPSQMSFGSSHYSFGSPANGASEGVTGGEELSPLQTQSVYYPPATAIGQQTPHGHLQQPEYPNQQHPSPYFESGNMNSMFGAYTAQPPVPQQQQRPSTAMPMLYSTQPQQRHGADTSAQAARQNEALLASVSQPRGSGRLTLKRPSHASDLGDDYDDDLGADGAGPAKRPARRTSEDDLAQCQYTVTTEICLRARNGDRSADVWYPRAPNVMAIMSQLGEPFTNGTTTLHFFAAAQQEREREQQLAMQHRQPQQQHFAYHPQQMQPFYHNMHGSASDGEQFGTAQSPRPYDGMSAPIIPSHRGSHPSTQAAQTPGILCYHPPPIEDFSHPNPHLRPRTQEERLRYPSDLYTPRWIRDEGAKREGWCSLCDQGQWLQLKTSQYWYHVKGAHGVNYHTGQIYDPPVQLRVFHDTCGTTHGLCGQCGEWIKIVTPRRKRNFASWFRHAQKCQRSQLPPGLFGFGATTTPSLTSSVPGTAAGLSGGAGGSSHGNTGFSAHLFSSQTGSAHGFPPGSSHSQRPETDQSETRNDGGAPSVRPWAPTFATAGALPPSTTPNTSAGVRSGIDTMNASNAAALSLPPSPRSVPALAQHRFARTQPASRDSASGQVGLGTTTAAPQTYEDLTSSAARSIRSAPHHVTNFYFSAGGTGTQDGSDSKRSDAAGFAGHAATDGNSCLGLQASSSSNSLANQFCIDGSSSGRASYSLLSGGSAHTFSNTAAAPATSPSAGTPRAPTAVSASWMG